MPATIRDVLYGPIAPVFRSIFVTVSLLNLQLYDLSYLGSFRVSSNSNLPFKSENFYEMPCENPNLDYNIRNSKNFHEFLVQLLSKIQLQCL